MAYSFATVKVLVISPNPSFLTIHQLNRWTLGQAVPSVYLVNGDIHTTPGQLATEGRDRNPTAEKFRLVNKQSEEMKKNKKIKNIYNTERGWLGGRKAG